MLCESNCLSHLVAVTKLWASEIQVPVAAVSMKNNSTSIQQRESECDPFALSNLGHEHFSLLLSPKTIKQTQWRFLTTLPKFFGVLERHCYTNASFQWIFSEYRHQVKQVHLFQRESIDLFLDE